MSRSPEITLDNFGRLMGQAYPPIAGSAVGTIMRDITTMRHGNVVEVIIQPFGNIIISRYGRSFFVSEPPSASYGYRPIFDYAVRNGVNNCVRRRNGTRELLIDTTICSEAEAYSQIHKIIKELVEFSKPQEGGKRKRKGKSKKNYKRSQKSKRSSKSKKTRKSRSSK